MPGDGAGLGVIVAAELAPADGDGLAEAAAASRVPVPSSRTGAPLRGELTLAFVLADGLALAVADGLGLLLAEPADALGDGVGVAAALFGASSSTWRNCSWAVWLTRLTTCCWV